MSCGCVNKGNNQWFGTSCPDQEETCQNDVPFFDVTTDVFYAPIPGGYSYLPVCDASLWPVGAYIRVGFYGVYKIVSTGESCINVINSEDGENIFDGNAPPGTQAPVGTQVFFSTQAVSGGGGGGGGGYTDLQAIHAVGSSLLDTNTIKLNFASDKISADVIASTSLSAGQGAISASSGGIYAVLGAGPNEAAAGAHNHSVLSLTGWPGGTANFLREDGSFAAPPPGPQGSPGTAATISVGTTSTLPAGSLATVTNSGTSSAAVFDFEIPKGDTGSTGPANSLSIGTVTEGPASATITGTAPSQTLNLVLPKGNTGSTGAAATITIGTVSTVSPSDPATVVNSGTSGAAVFDFEIPKGDTGSTGAAATISIGTVDTVGPSDPATVTNSGTSGAAIFDFEIPKGDTGSAGPANSLSIGTVTEGPANATITGTAPTQTLNLVIPKGNQGDPGSNGAAATIAVGTVSTVDSTDPATVTNSGTSSAAVFDFEIPKGEQGPGPNENIIPVTISSSLATLDFAGGNRNFDLGTITGDFTLEADNLGSTINGRRGVIFATQDSTGGRLVDYETNTFDRTTGVNPQLIPTPLRRQVIDYVVADSRAVLLTDFKPVVPIYTAGGWPTPLLHYDFSALANNDTTVAGTVASNVVTGLTNLGSMSGADLSGLTAPWDATGLGGLGCMHLTNSSQIISLPTISGPLDVTILAVFKLSGSLSNGFPPMWKFGTSSDTLYHPVNPTSDPRMYGDEFSSTPFQVFVNGEPFLSGLSPAIWMVSCTSAGAKNAYVDGVLKQSASTGFYISPTPKLGGFSGSNTQLISEFFLFDTILTTNQRAAITAALQSKYSIP